jgi:hypothetical protein
MNYRRISIILFSGISALFIFGYPFFSVLEVRDFNSGQLLECFRILSGEEFGIFYIHSVNKRPVLDTFRTEKDSLIIVKSRFDAFGAGMPDQSTAEGNLNISSDGSLEWIVNRKIPDVVIRVGYTADHRLHIKGNDIRLADFVNPGMPVLIKSRSQGFVNLIKDRCKR